MTFTNILTRQAREPRAARAQRRRDERLTAILDAALVVAARDGYLRMTRADVARQAGVANGSINHAFATMDALREAVMRAAVERKNVAVVRQGIAVMDKVAMASPPELREAVVRSIA